MYFEKKDLFFKEFSKTLQPGDHQFLSFYKNISADNEFDLLFSKVIENYGQKHVGIYRMCDAEYRYCVGRRMPYNLSFPRKIRYRVKTALVKLGIVNEKTGHENKVNKEMWFGENYSLAEKRAQKQKYISDLREISKNGWLAPHLVYSKGHFAEEFIDPMLDYFRRNAIDLNKDNYFPFYFVYVMMSLEHSKSLLYKNRNVLVVTAFNERNRQENFTANLIKEGARNIYFYNISHDKSMLEVIDKSKLPEQVDLVLIGAGIGSVNIINQLTHLNALCIDAGHALDCLSRPQLRVERICLLPDSDIQ